MLLRFCHSIFRQAACDNSCDVVLKDIHSWIWLFRRNLQQIGHTFTHTTDVLAQLDRSCLEYAMQCTLRAALTDLGFCHRTCPFAKILLCTYQCWLAKLSWPCTAVIHVNVRASLMRMFFRLRAGCRDLSIDSGRHRGVPRNQHFCTKCACDLVGDEFHLIFEFEALTALREKYHMLFNASISYTSTVRHFLWQADMVSVVCLINEALQVLPQ